MGREPRSMLFRYLLWQLPGWLLAAGALALIARATGLAWWIVIGAIAVVIARDIVLYPVMRVVFRPPSPPYPLGAHGVTIEPLRPRGMIRVHGELWRACAVGDAIKEQDRIVVAGARGLTLFVKRPDDT
jgi:membrane protein implicated in regulation of membrane protease activity